MNAAPLLRLQDVTKGFGGIRALSGISFEVASGQIVGVIGPNGAGKTSMFNVITGAYRADSGRVLLAGEDVTNFAPHRIARAGISRTFQNIRLFGGMTVWEHLLVAQPHRESALRRALPTGWADPVALERAREVLDFFALGETKDRIARSLPYGMQRRVEMARAVTAHPKLLLLDEPVAGMNHDEAHAIGNLIRRLRDQGFTILLIEHDMPFVMGVCDYLHVLDFGAMIAQGRPQDVRTDPAVLDAYLGHAA